MAANPAAVAYEAYRQCKNASQQSDSYLIPWNLIPEHEKLAWWAVVRAMQPRRDQFASDEGKAGE